MSTVQPNHPGDPSIENSRKRRNSTSPTHSKKPKTTDSHVDEREMERERQRKQREMDENLSKKLPQIDPQTLVKNMKNSGIYIPPHKLKNIQPAPKDKNSMEYQKLNWEALKKSINGIINKVNITNIKNIIPELFAENLVRGRGLFCRAIMKAQQASPTFSHVYSAIISVINTKMPEIGELILKRVISGFKKAYQRNDKTRCLSCAQFLAHLVNQQVGSEILAGQLLGLLLEKPTDDSIELAITFTKECGFIMMTSAPKILNAVFERFRGILHEGDIDKRVQYLIEGLFSVRQKNFSDFPGVVKELDLVVPSEQITHDVDLNSTITTDDHLDYFHFDKDFVENEVQYDLIKKEILGEEETTTTSESVTEQLIPLQEVSKTKLEQGDKEILDSINLKKQIYLTIMSSVNFEETVHKLVKAGLTENHEMEVCTMIIECCSQERTYLRYYGLMAQRFCFLDKTFQIKFDECFKQQYSMVHRLDTNKLRNVAKFFAHLMNTDALSWSVMNYIKLTQEDTSSSSRIFVKILFQELCENMGLKRLNDRLHDEYLKEYYTGIFPRDSAKNMRFAINFFTSIGLGGLTEDLRIAFKNAPKQKESDSSSDSSDDSDSSDSSSSDSSDSE